MVCPDSCMPWRKLRVAKRMPRHARLRIAGLPLHVVQRGNNRSACFSSDSDRTVYLALLQELSQAHGCAVHAYVLMSNHVHLLVTPKVADSASLMMKHLGQRYVQFVNRHWKRTGSLWEGRFHSSIIDTQSYFFTCHRYIELNPVRAGMILHPEQYPWSSYCANALQHRSELITPHGLYLALGSNAAVRCKAYRALFETAVGDEELRAIREATNGGFALGTKAFVENLGRALGRRVARGVAGRPKKESPDESLQQPTLFRMEEKRGLSPV